jgi:FtsZ-binding cell division protein ZapB
MKDENLIAYAKEAGVKAVEDQMDKLAPAIEILTRQNDLLTTENTRLRQEREQLKDSNSKLSRENADFKAVANRMRELSLDKVLIEMYGAAETPNSKPKNKTRSFTLPDGLTVEYSSDQWHSQHSGRKGKGAINLAMYLSGYGQDNYQQTVRDMAEIFGDKDIVGSLANYLVETAPQQASKISRQRYQMPEPCRRTWPDVRDYLVNKVKLPTAFVDQLHEDGLIFSDHRYNCVFPRDNATGVFKIGTGNKPFKQTLGKDGGPFVINGSNDKVHIVDSPMEALSLKLMQPDSTILATGGFMLADKLKPYLDKKDISLALSQGKIGLEMTKYLAGHFPKAQRIHPDKGKSWNEYRLLQAEEAKNAQAQIAARDQVGKHVAIPYISRPSGLSR